MNSADSFALIHLPAAHRAATEPVLIDLTRVQRPTRPAAQSEFIRMCSWCQRVASGEDWVQPENSPPKRSAVPPPITHGICPACLARVLHHELRTA